MTPDLEDATGQRLDVRRVDVDREHRALRADALCHPRRDRAAAGACFQAALARADS